MGRASTTRRGTAGTYVGAGQILGVESNLKLLPSLARGGPTSAGVWHQMRTQDPTVAALLAAVKAPLLGAPIEILPPDDADDAELEIAAFVEAAWAGMEGGPRQFMRSALTYLEYGFAIFEEVYRRTPDGMLTWRGLETRLQTTVQQWVLSEATDSLAEVEFWAPFGGQHFTTYRLPASALTIFCRGREGNNWEGISLLRPAYTFWLAKRTAIRATAIDVERGGGFLKFKRTEPGDWTTEDELQHAEIAENWRLNEYAYATLPHGADMEFTYPDIPLAERTEWLRYLDQQIVQSFMATFLELGLGPTGTQALSRDLRSNFLGALRSEADGIEDTLNSVGGETVGGPIQRLVDFNFGPQPQGRYPRLRIGRLSDVDADRALETLVRGRESGVFGGWGPDDSAKARDLADLPPLPKAEVPAEDEDLEEPGEPEAEPKPEAEPEPEAEIETDEDEVPTEPLAQAAAHRHDHSGVQTWSSVAAPGEDLPDRDADGVPIRCNRRLTEIEGVVAFAAIERTLDEATEGFEAAVKPALTAVGAGLAEATRAVVAGTGDVAAKLRKLLRLQADEEATERLEAVVAKHLAGVSEQAKAQASAEIKRQVKRPVAAPPGAEQASARPVSAVDRTPLDEVIPARSMVAAAALIEAVLASARAAGTRALQAGGGEGTGRAQRDLDELVSGRSEGWYRRQAAGPVGETAARAREDGLREGMAAAGIEEVEYVLYSAILDDNTCPVCRGLDALVMAYGSSDYDELFPPNQNCDGGAACRCMFVFGVSPAALAVEEG